MSHRIPVIAFAGIVFAAFLGSDVRAGAAACAAAIDTPSTAFAPSRPRFGVPSSAIILRSIAR